MGFRHKSPFIPLAKIGSISFGCSFVTDKSLVPIPAAGITAFLNTLNQLFPGLASTAQQFKNSLVAERIWLAHADCTLTRKYESLNFALLDSEPNSNSYHLVPVSFWTWFQGR